MANFVSSREINAAKALKKQENREARDLILKEAEKNYERRKRRKEQQDDDWLAPGIASRLENKSTKNQKKHKSKEKKKRSKKAKYMKEESPSDSESEDSYAWVEKSASTSAPGGEAAGVDGGAVTADETGGSGERQSWMTTPMESLTHKVFSITPPEKEKVKVPDIDNPGQHPRELNPYWKSGGSGLPQEKDDKSAGRESRTGDGGRSWMLRSYKRALEQAKDENKTIEEIAIKRWGSLKKLYSLLQAAGIDPENPDKVSRSSRREYLYAEPPSSSRHLDRSFKRTEIAQAKTEESGPKFLIPSEQDLESNFTQKPSRNWQRPQEDSTHHIKPSTQPSIAPPPNQEEMKEKVEEVRQEIGESVQEVNEPEVTDAQLNALSAKVMKAEMMGDIAKVEKLKKKLEHLREVKNKQSSTKASNPMQPSEQAIPLVSTDRLGRVVPVSSSKAQDKRPPLKQKGKKKYLDDGQGQSVQDLLQQERGVSSRDAQFALAGLSSKFVSSNSDGTIDEHKASKVAVSFDSDGKDVMRAMAESKKIAQAMETCKYCFGNDSFNKNLLIALGINAYLAAPSHQSLTEGHCLIVPMEHQTSMIMLDENVWDEIKVFQRGLTRMFSDLDQDVVFTETCFVTNKRSHAFIECIPLPKEQGELAPMYFKKAILESEEEWSLNRKLIDTKAKGVKKSLPLGLPYFFVDFGLDGGFAHIVEGNFPGYFAKEVIGGMLDIEPRLWLRPPPDSTEAHKRKVLQIAEWWRPYDWTQQLK